MGKNGKSSWIDVWHALLTALLGLLIFLVYVWLVESRIVGPIFPLPDLKQHQVGDQFPRHEGQNIVLEETWLGGHVFIMEEMPQVEPLDPVFDDGLNTGQIEGGLLGGTWYYNDEDELGIHEFTWVSFLEVEGVMFQVEILFDDFDMDIQRPVYFRLESIREPSDLTVIEVGSEDGEYLHDSSFSNLGINWEDLGRKLRAEFLYHYFELRSPELFAPDPTPAPEPLPIERNGPNA